MSSILESAQVTVPLQGLPIPAALLDTAGTVVAANQRFEQLCSGGDDGRLQLRLRDVLAESSRQALDEALHILNVLGEEAPPMCGLRVVRASSPLLWFELDLSVVDGDGPGRYLACLRPLGGRRRMDTINESAHRQQGRREASPGIEPWLATLSHEFRGPLQAIRGWAQLAGQGGLSSEKLTRAFDVIGRNAATLSNMIEKLFDLSRGEKGSLVLERRTFDLNSIVQLVVESALPAARCRNLILSLRRARTALVIDGDPLRLEQVIRNLVDNAVKFTPTGGHVKVHTAVDAESAELLVTDDGVGIPSDLLPVIFEPSRQGELIERPSERGLGLGLALVRELVQLHGGEVRAFSGGAGQGSTFVVRIPLANTALAA